jgi:hypothetical protein
MDDLVCVGGVSSCCCGGSTTRLAWHGDVLRVRPVIVIARACCLSVQNAQLAHGWICWRGDEYGTTLAFLNFVRLAESRGLFAGLDTAEEWRAIISGPPTILGP